MLQEIKSYLTLIAALILSLASYSQSCDNPTSLCGGESAGVSEFNPGDFSGTALESCLTGDAWSVARFHTTYLNSDNGVTVNLQNVDCLNTTLQAVVVLPDQLDYCDLSQYTVVSDCISLTSDTSFETDQLLVNMDYLVLFCHQTGIVPTPCELSLIHI